MINLRKLREAAGLSQERLGELSGLSRFAILEYEAGRRSPTFTVAKRISSALGCSIADLDDENPTETSGSKVQEAVQVAAAPSE